MLYKDIEAVSKILISDNGNLFNTTECWVRKENNYNLYIFTILVKNEFELESLWLNLTNAIAMYFQSELEKDIEKWNIYVIFFVREKVSMDCKYKIEQDKYSSRKIVMDNIIDINLEEIIESRLFGFNFPELTPESNNEKDENLHKSPPPNPTTNLKDLLGIKNEKLSFIIENFADEKPVNQLIKYLGR